MVQERKSRRGRPRVANPKTAVFATRITPQLRDDLEKAKAASGRRSLSEEIELRLKESLRQDERIAATWGSVNTLAIFQACAMAIRTIEFGQPKRWYDDPDLHEQAMFATVVVQSILGPKGEAPSPSPTNQNEIRGHACAMGTLAQIAATPQPPPEDGGGNRYAKEYRQAGWISVRLGRSADRAKRAL